MNNSDQGYAYLSSAVGGSVSSLSFEDHGASNRVYPGNGRSRGVRGKVRGFSGVSRRNLLRRLAGINRRAFRAFEGRLISVTLTYPGEYPEDPEVCKGHLKALRKRLQRQYGPFAAFWRLGIQERVVALPPAPVRGAGLWFGRQTAPVRVDFVVRGHREGLRRTPSRRHPRRGRPEVERGDELRRAVRGQARGVSQGVADGQDLDCGSLFGSEAQVVTVGIDYSEVPQTQRPLSQPLEYGMARTRNAPQRTRTPAERTRTPTLTRRLVARKAASRSC